jgi:hypothetical protein
MVTRRPIFASGAGGQPTPRPASPATPPPPGWSTTPGPGLVATTRIGADGLPQQGYLPGFAPADIGASARVPTVPGVDANGNITGTTTPAPRPAPIHQGRQGSQRLATPQVQAPAASSPAASSPAASAPPPGPTGGVVTDAQFQTMLQALIDGNHAPNPLGGFWQVAYHWRLFIMTDQDVYEHTKKPDTISQLYAAIDQLPQITIAESGVTGYSIKSVETRAKVGPNPETRNTNIFQFTIEIVEPISVGFLDALKDAALALQIKNLNKCPYFLELSFRAYDETGAVVLDPLSQQPDAQTESSRWIWEIQILDIDTRLDAGGGQYTLTAQVYNDGAVETDILTVPQNLVMKGVKIGDVLRELGTAMTRSWQTRYGDKLVEYEFTMHKITNPPPTITDTDPNNYKMMAQNPTLRSVRLDPAQPASSGQIQAQVAAGTSYTDIVQWIMMNNENTQKLGLDKDNRNLASIIDRIETDVEITGYDEVSANYAKKVHIHIWPFYTQAILTGPDQRDDAQNPEVQGQMVKALLARRFLYKHYEYLHTGLNTEVLEFDIRSNFKWNALLPNMGGRHGGVDNLEAARNFPPISDARATDRAAFDAKVKAIMADDKNASQKLRSATEQSDELQTQIDPLQRQDQEALDVINDPNNARTADGRAAIAKATALRQKLQPQLRSLTDLKAAKSVVQIEQHDRINRNAQNLQADREQLFPKAALPNFAEDLLLPDGSATTDASTVQYEYFNYAVSFRQGYRDASAQSGTGFLGAYHQAKSTFGALIDQLYAQETTQLANVELTIRGDPYWIGPSNLNRTVLLRGGDNPNAGSETAFHNLPNWIVGDQTFLLTFKYPILIGEDGKPVFKSNDTFDGIYRVTEVTSTFADGMFKQRLKGQIITLINIATAFGNIKALRPTGATPQSGAASSGRGGSSSASTPALTRPAQQENARAFRDALKTSAAAKGITLTDANIDGIVANAYRESGMNPGSNSIDSNGKPSAGLLQWNGPRNTAFANTVGVAPQNATIQQQADYTVHELTTTERGTLTALQSASTAEASQATWIARYERPADPTAGAAKNRSFLPNLYATTTPGSH